MSLVNDLINKRIFKAPEPPRDSWSWGTVAAEPVGNVVDVLLDGDTVATTMRYGCPCVTGNRVMTQLQGRSRAVAYNLDWWIPA
jgi:hypothetical protein